MDPWKVVGQLAARALEGGPTEGVQAAAVTAAAEATGADWSWLTEPTDKGTRLLCAGVGWPVEACGFLQLPDESPPAPLAERGLTVWHEAKVGTRAWLGVGAKKPFGEEAGELLRSLAAVVSAALDLRVVAKLAHDYNNQLTTIAVSVDFLLEESDAEDPRRPDILEVKAAGERAAELTRGLSTLARR